MRSNVRRVVAALCMVATLTVAAATGHAATIPPPSSQLLDVSKQLTKIADKTKKLATVDSATAAALCGAATTSQMFLPWSDTAQYVLAPQGDLASSDQWSLAGASLSTERDPYSGAKYSLRLGSSGQAATPTTCINAGKPTIRFFARNTGAAMSTLRVDVLYVDAKGKVSSLTVARLVAGSMWQPTIVVPIHLNTIAALLPAGEMVVAFKFAVEGSGGNWSIAGIYVDPWCIR